MKYRKMTREDLLAAELFNYSYAHYAEHLEVETERFTRLMPETVRKLEKAERESWTAERSARQLGIEESDVATWLDDFKSAKEIVDAENPSESFRRAVKESIKQAIAEGLENEESVDDLVIQICYRAADLGCLLEWEGKRLIDYSEWLRREKDVDYTGIDLPNLT